MNKTRLEVYIKVALKTFWRGGGGHVFIFQAIFNEFLHEGLNCKKTARLLENEDVNPLTYFISYERGKGEITFRAKYCRKYVFCFLFFCLFNHCQYRGSDR